MTRIITINRQFSSGGREIGKRLAKELNMPYLDKEIALKTAEESGLDIDYINDNSEIGININCPYTYGRTFASSMELPSDTVHNIQNNIMKEMAEKGDGIFVGRCADYLLEEFNPVRVLIYCSDIETRIKRCYEKGQHDTHITEKEMEKQIKKVDKARSKYYSFVTGNDWMKIENYDIAINMSRFSIDQAVEVLKGVVAKKG